MTIDWYKFIGALLLLLTPAAVFHREKVRFHPISSDWNRHWAQILSLGTHTLDLGRALLGTLLLADALQVVPGTQGFLRHAELITQAVTLALGVTVQTTVCKQADAFNAPFLFLLGAIFGQVPLLVAAFAGVLALVIAAGTRAPVAFFPTLAVSVVAMGVLFAGKRLLLNLAVAACAALLPWLLALLFSRELVVARRLRHAEPHSRPSSQLR